MVKPNKVEHHRNKIPHQTAAVMVLQWLSHCSSEFPDSDLLISGQCDQNTTVIRHIVPLPIWISTNNILLNTTCNWYLSPSHLSVSSRKKKWVLRCERLQPCDDEEVCYQENTNAGFMRTVYIFKFLPLDLNVTPSSCFGPQLWQWIYSKKLHQKLNSKEIRLKRKSLQRSQKICGF